MAKRKRVLFKSKELRDAASVAAFLRELADKLETREVVLRQAEDKAVLAVGDRISFKVKVKQKRKKRGVQTKLGIKMKWVEGSAAKEEVTVE